MSSTSPLNRHTGPPNSAWPPGPSAPWWGLPLLLDMRRDYLGFTQRLHADHGDIAHMQVGRDHLVDLFHPDLVRECLVDNAAHLVRWKRGMEVFEEAHGQSLLVAEGAQWQTRRRRLQVGFAPKPVTAQAPMIVSATAQTLDEWGRVGGPQEVDIDAEMTGLTMDVIMRTLFSDSARDRTHEVGRAVRIISETGMKEMFWPMTLPDWLPLPGKAAKRWALRTLDAVVRHHLRARLALGDAARHDDLLDMLLHCEDPKDPVAGGGRFTEEEVRDECMTTFLAGHETTASALAWWCGLMAAHPQAMQQAQAEIDQVLGSRTPTPADLTQLPWLGQTMKESLRLCPPAPALLSRSLTAPIRLGDWHLPRGTMIRITPWVLHHDARWFPEPERFLPERFGPEAPPVPRGAWLPFGAGPRVCIGQHFALMEMQLVAAMLLQRFDLAMPLDAPIRTGCAALPPASFNVTLRPGHGLRLRLTPRAPISASSANLAPRSTVSAPTAHADNARCCPVHTQPHRSAEPHDTVTRS